jgi:hypothetical protein
MGCGVALTYFENKNQIYIETLGTNKDEKTKKGSVNEVNSFKFSKAGEIGKVKSLTNNNN